ncbi:hypothetical protein [Streptomyces sp. NPDC048473]|uniref:hypothetical protein n=1 Tax=unclassified Streptomyces TaxID=2593676 RepID=UPI00371D0489
MSALVPTAPRDLITPRSVQTCANSAVVFALDATAGRDTGDAPVVRVSCVGADSGEAVAVDELRAAPSRRILPMVG